jgi:hypothetical protein
MPKAPCSNSFLAWGVGRAVQQWMRDRDLLVEETLAFVQTVATGNPVRIETAKQMEPPNTVAIPPIAKPKDKLSERDVIRKRVADFKATQHKFEREREDYYRRTMSTIHSGSTENLT